MRGYDREEVDEYEDYDDYEEEGYKQEEEGGEEEYEEEEERKPTAEELEYLELRERIKEQIRKKMQRESGSGLSKSQEKKKKLPCDNYGSFFGPSQPVIAQRVIQESKSLLENPHLALRVANSHNNNKKSSSSSGTGLKNGVTEKQPKVKNQLQMKVQKLKDTRDYSFLLSDDAELPAHIKDHSAPRIVSAPSSEARTAQVSQKGKQLLGNTSRNIHGGREERRPISANGQHSKQAPLKPPSVSKSNSISMDSRRQLGSNNGIGPGRPGQKGLPSKAPVANIEKKASAPVTKKILPAAHKPPPPKMQSSASKQHLEPRKGLQQEPNRSRMMPKQPVTSAKPQINRPVKQMSSHASLQDNRMKKKPMKRYSDEDDDGDDLKALSMIRKMFNVQRFAARDDDDSDMEANFDDIMREERRSSKIAREEDEEQLRLIEEEERRERMRKMAKKRKLSQR